MNRLLWLPRVQFHFSAGSPHSITEQIHSGPASVAQLSQLAVCNPEQKNCCPVSARVGEDRIPLTGPKDHRRCASTLHGQDLC